MNRKLLGMMAAALLAGWCSTPPPSPCNCSQPCPYLVNNPNGKCPCNSELCQCVPTHISQVNTYSTANPAAKVNPADYKKVILDGFQPEWVSVQEIRKSRTNDGYERIQVLVKNLTASSIRTRYRFDWQDANGVVIMDPDHSGWEKLTLIPGDDGTYTSIAPRKDCADFRLRMAIIQSN